ncbi:serine/threonine-protein kinase AfsK [Streptomyces chrestomyceticus JCM 4735]|uniref:Serine/threonine-protein kinase AfsK n=1 Tax=Streptomyces chrestomyceticus JCM 4735 TaxID=1306181 RepID=A0A7U9KWY9_9ACTN|nr:PQQ-binding-like beta-propeller repeat protein [Streptomyces chrestomyceticus]GCD36930.1 serine/threonine-protein kinase AfsK [Streptomyces chrestomyceticus JCM 4735]
MVEQLTQLTQHDPRRIGPFEVLGRLGAGGMGLVYLARSASGRRVAIKTVRTELAEDQLFRVRFTREVEAARAVSGFYTAAVVDADPRAAVPWLATAYVPAPSLEEIVNECGPLPAQAVRWLAAGIAEALQSIHGAGLVHRDLKPSNVLVVEDGPRVIDFGIASGVSNTRLTMTNVAVGTPAYMSPEQARDSRSVTGASDVFSLGSTLVFAATGHAPFHGANPVETVFMLLREGPDLAGLPDELRPLIESCMQMEAPGRPTPADLQSQLAPHLFGSGSDDSGTASAWLPDGAVALIEGRRGGRQTTPAAAGRGGTGQPRAARQPVPHSPPPAQPSPPRPRNAPAVAAAQAGGAMGAPAAEPGWAGAAGVGPGARRAADPRGAAQPPQSAPAGPVAAAPPVAAPPYSAAPPAASRLPDADVPDGSVRLAGTSAPIGPGPRAGDGGPPQQRAQAPATDWVRPPAGTPGAPGHGTHEGDPGAHLPQQGATPGPGSGAPATGAGGASGGAAPARWRPWRFRMSNDVWGTPTVAGDLLYVTSFEVHALDVASGRRQFKTRDVAWSMSVADGRIHASDGPSLYALDAADGTERWRLGSDGWIYALKADRGTVVTATRGGGVQAWEAATGERLWETGGVQTDFETADLGPVLHEGTVLLWADGRLKALEARTGAERWSYPVGDAASCGGVPVRLLPAPDGAVYVTAGSRVLAIDLARGEVRWHFEAPAAFLSRPAFAPGPAVTGGGLYLADYLGTVYALDAADGRDRWRIATEARQSTEPVLVADGAVHLGSGQALYTLDAVTGTPRWRFQAGGEVIGAPVVADGRVHFGSADHCLYTLDATGGQLRWKLATGGEITGTPVAAGGVVYACSKDRCVYALDAAKGTGLARRS